MPNYRDTMASFTSNLRDGPIKASFPQVIDLQSEFESEAAKLAGNGDLSADGKRKAARAFLGKNAHRFIRAEQFVQRGLERIAETEAKLELPAYDETDAMAAAMAVALAQRFFAMSPAERKVTLSTASLPGLQAILAAPAELTGLNSELRQAARARALEIAHPGKLEQINQDRESLRLLGSAVRAARDVARQFAGLPNDFAFTETLNSAVPDQRRILAEVERETQPLAA